MVRHPRIFTDLGQVSYESSERGTIRHKYGEVIKSKQATAWYRSRTRSLAKLEDCSTATGRR
jgi:hypothetical protein